LQGIFCEMNSQPKRLLIEAYENELTIELTKLATKFNEWKEGEISAGELSHLIHEYDTGPSRDMFKFYNNVAPTIVVGRAVAEGLLKEEDIPEEIWPYIQNTVQFWKTNLGDDEEEAASREI
jgi:hypothetical protein